MISQLNQRERIFVAVGGGILVLALVYFAIVAPYRSALRKLDQQIEARSAQVQEVKLLQTSYLDLKQQMAQVERLLDNRQGFTSLTFIEGLVEQTAGRENLLSMRPQSPETRNEFIIDAVEIKLEKLTLEQVLELLVGIEEADAPMQVKNLYLKQRFDDRSLLDATMTVTSLRRKT
jgi:general secretion pathway protein M